MGCGCMRHDQLIHGCCTGPCYNVIHHNSAQRIHSGMHCLPQGGRRSALVAIGSLVGGIQVARWLVQGHDDSSSGGQKGASAGRSGQAAYPWGVSALWPCWPCT